ncbi:Insertion element protein [Actinokineospora sp. NPDC004072]
MTERAVPYHCPFCGEEDLRPHDEPPGSWACWGCRRVFTVKFAGLLLGGATAGVDA